MPPLRVAAETARAAARAAGDLNMTRTVTARQHRSLRVLMVALARLPTQLANSRCDGHGECASHGHIRAVPLVVRG